MVIFVIFFNLALALILLYGAWRVRKLQPVFGRVADKILVYERSTDKVLHRAPMLILKGQLGILRLKQKQQQLQPQLQRVRQVLTLFRLSQQVWRLFVRTQRSPFGQNLAKYK